MDTGILTVLIILFGTVVALIFEIFRLDVVALICMLALGWTGVLTPQETLSGFASNAVIAMIAVMILGQGIAKTGIMDRFSRAVLEKVGTKKSRVIGVLSFSAGILSGFIQNIGTAALFLPGILHISRREKIPASALIMPIGFAAIIGGTLSMVGSGPLILINDLLRSADLAPYGLFSVTPVGMALLLSGIGFFFLFGNTVLPHVKSPDKSLSEQDKLIELLNLPHHIWHYVIPPESALAGQTTEESAAWGKFNINILGISQGREAEYAPCRESTFEVGQDVAVLGTEEKVRKFAATYHLIPQEQANRFSSLNDPQHAGFAEVIIPPRSELVNQTIRQFSLRKRYAVEPVVMFSKGEEIRGDLSDRQILPGDTMIIHGLWENIKDLKTSADFVVVTPFTVRKRQNTSKSWVAALCFLFAIGLAISGAPISLSFITGAIAMVLTRTLTMQEAYQAIEWKVVFLIAGLIPLGIAMQKTGTAAFLAERVILLVQGGHPALILLTVAVLSTLFSLFLSNVGAIVVLAPLVMSMAEMSGIDPRPLALLAAVCAANSFILPTHQVNAFLMSSGGYRNADYIKAGGGMTLLFLVVVVPVFYFFYQ